MDGRQLSLVAGAGSAALLAGALGFQALGYAPCELCLLQRWPHVVAVIAAGLVILTGRLRVFATLGLIAALSTMGLGIFHAGVELGLWEGFTSCSVGAGSMTGLSPAEVMARLQAAPLIRCDQVAWSLFGISMAGWNAILSAGLAAVWGLAILRGR